MRKYIWIFLSLLFLGGCESLEDTYSDYAGDGEIRYLGKSTNISVSPGWKRLIVKWKNNIDPVIDKIKITWTVNGVTKDTLLDKNATECSIPHLEDGNYEVSVCSVDKEGKYSLTDTYFERPYTSTHESVLSFTRLIAKHYFVKNRLVLFFSNWQENVTSAVLHYSSAGVQKTLNLNQELLNRKYYLLPDVIDSQSKVRLERSGRLEGCSDLIVFDPYELTYDKMYSADFKQLARAKYGQEEITNAFVNSLEELEIDYSITSFDDILHLPNLKTLVLAKNRFQKEQYLNYYDADKAKTYGSDSELYEVERSLFVLGVANELHELQVKRYNQHYLPGVTLLYMEEMKNPKEPEITCLDTKDWKITCSPKDTEPFNSYLKNLFDGNLANWWQPELLPTERSHEITVDLKELKKVSGVKVTQKNFNPEDDAMSTYLLPEVIKVKISKDGVFWNDATHVEENTMGGTAGETTIINFSSPKEIQYVRFIIDDHVVGQNFSISLAEIGIF